VLVNGHIVRRYKRFLADVVLEDGQEVTAHCPNTGRMTSCWVAGAPVQLSHSDNPRRKLAWTLERVDMGSGWVGVHTGRTNPVVGEALRGRLVKTLDEYREVIAEPRLELPGHPAARLDFRLESPGLPIAWVEVKNSTLLAGEAILFPDAVTERGAKHLRLLAELVARGDRGVMLFAVNRPEGYWFEPAAEIDPNYARILAEVAAQGVELIAYRICHHPAAMVLGDELPVRLPTVG